MGTPLWTTVLLLCSFAARQVHLASVDGISDPNAAEALRAEPAITSGDLACAVILQPYRISEPSPTTLRAPTVSLPPDYVTVAVNFEVIDKGSQDFAEPWLLRWYNTEYLQVLQSTNLTSISFSNKTVSAVVGPLQQWQGPTSLKRLAIAELGLKGRVATMIPTLAWLNDVPCSITLINNITGPYLPFQNGASRLSTQTLQRPMRVDKGQFYDVNGELFNLKCANWFGFNNGQTMLDGLWAASTSMVVDFSLVSYRIQLLGFNCLRLPFSFHDLFTLAPKTWNWGCTPSSQDDIRNNMIPPCISIPNTTDIPPQAYPEGNRPDACNDVLPNDSTYHRFLWIIQFFVRNGFYLIIDNHTEDPTAGQNVQTWIQYWVQLVTDIVADETSARMVMVDLLNEPDFHNLNWTSVTPYYLGAMEAIHAVSSSTLFLLEGCGQTHYPGINWGDGFVADAGLIEQYGLSDPKPFFRQLMLKPYLDNVIISPHIFPPSVTYASLAVKGGDLYNRLYYSFGYLADKGFYNGDFTKIFPILISEVGSAFNDPKDLVFMHDLAAWMTADPSTGINRLGVSSLGWWAWNANSGDTAGLIDSVAWTDVQWRKIFWLMDAIYLQPWFSVAEGSTNTCAPSVAALPPPPPPVRSTPVVGRLSPPRATPVPRTANATTVEIDPEALAGSNTECFPGHVWVQTPQGRRQMHSLQLGDKVLAIDAKGRLRYEEVFMFSHWDALATAVHITLCSHGDACISATAGHYIWTSLAEAGPSAALSFERHAKPIAARDVRVRDMIWLTDGTGGLRPHAVLRRELGLAQGLYNPHVPSGGVLVNGVAALTFSDVLPPSLAWHAAVTTPGRLLYACMPSLKTAALVNRALAASGPAAAFRGVLDALTSWVSQHQAHL